MTEFQTYQPETWFYDGLIVASDFDSPETESHVEKRSLPWNMLIPRALMTVGVFAASSLFFSSITAGASSLDAIPVVGVRASAFIEPPKKAELSPLADINRGFNALFESMRSGAKVVVLEDMRSLAKKAVQLRDEKVDIDSWARRLADDVKDADD